MRRLGWVSHLPREIATDVKGTGRGHARRSPSHQGSVHVSSGSLIGSGKATSLSESASASGSLLPPSLGYSAV